MKFQSTLQDPEPRISTSINPRLGASRFQDWGFQHFTFFQHSIPCCIHFNCIARTTANKNIPIHDHMIVRHKARQMMDLADLIVTHSHSLRVSGAIRTALMIDWEEVLCDTFEHRSWVHYYTTHNVMQHTVSPRRGLRRWQSFHDGHDMPRCSTALCLCSLRSIATVLESRPLIVSALQ